MSRTLDEARHTRYGRHILELLPDRLFEARSDSQMPSSALNALPGFIASSLGEGHLRRSAFLGDFRTARFPTILATLLLNVMVYLWAYDLFGAEAALAACLLSVLSPSLIAHGTLATTDMYGALGVVGSLYFFHRFLVQSTAKNAILSGLTLALAQITKPFVIVLYGIVGVALMIALCRRERFKLLTLRRIFGFAAIAAASFVVVINVAYSFDRTFTPMSSYRFESSSMAHLQQIPLLREVPVPLPYPFLQGLDMTKHNEQSGQSFGNVYLLGEIRDGTDKAFHGFKSYYVVALFFKEPIALQVLFFLGLIWIGRNRSLDDVLSGEGLLLAAAIILLVWLSFFDRAQIGIRHILAVLAIDTIIAGAAFSGFSSQPRGKKVALSVLVLWMTASVASYFPQMIPYMNEWVPDRRLSYKILADSNLDWGQDAYLVKEFMQKNPDVILNPDAPVAGRILVGANRLTGIERWNPPLTFLQNYKPVAQVGYAHFLFVVPAEDISSEPAASKKQK